MDHTIHLLIMYTMLVLMLVLLQKARSDRKSLFLAIYALIEVFTNGIYSITLWGGTGIYEKFPALLFLVKPVVLLWVPFFSFYVFACFSNKFEFKSKHLLHLLPFGLIMLFYIVVRIVKGAELIGENLFRLGTIESYSLYVTDILLKVQYVAYIFYMINKLLKIERALKREGELKSLTTHILWLRIIVYGYSVACLGALVTFVLFHINPVFAEKFNVVSVLYFFLYFFIIFFDTVSPKPLLDILKVAKKPLPDSELLKIVENLKALFNKKPLYLDPDLSLKQLASELNESERKISQAINAVEHRVFKDFINEMRIKHAMEILKKEVDKPIFEVMYESGFNTKGPFNTAFKKVAGVTPTQFRKK